MFVYYLDECLTQYWKLFFLGIGMVGFLVAGTFAIRSLRAWSREKALTKEGITGERLRTAHMGISRNLIGAVLAFVAAIGVFFWYIDFYSDFECTPDSVFWLEEH